MKNVQFTIKTTLLLAALLASASACSSEPDEEADTSGLLVLLNNFTDNFNGTITQNTGQTWMKCVQGQVWDAGLNTCAGTGGGTTYGALSMQFCSTLTGNYADCTSADATTPTATSGPAFTSCDSLSFATFTDWRLPLKVELEAFVSGLNRNSLLYVFPQTPDDKLAWSGVGNEGQSDGSEAYGVNFSESKFGETETVQKDAVHYVRCVR